MPAKLSFDVSSSIPSTPLRKSLNITSSHLSRLPATPRTAALVEVRSRHALQSSTSLTISSFSTLLAELNGPLELDHRLGFEQDRIDKIEQFREDFMTGSLMRVQPPTLRDEGDVESYSDGTRRSSLGATTASSVNSSQEVDEPTASQGRRIFQMPLDPVSRGIIAEKTIKSQLAAERVLLPHEDYASLARVARRAIKKALRLKRPVYVDPGLLHSVDWRKEYRERGWAAPGIRWGPFKPDLIKFEEVTRKSEEEERQVSWEVVEVKYAGKTRDVVRSSPLCNSTLSFSFSCALFRSIQTTKFKLSTVRHLFLSSCFVLTRLTLASAFCRSSIPSSTSFDHSLSHPFAQSDLLYLARSTLPSLSRETSVNQNRSSIRRTPSLRSPA